MDGGGCGSLKRERIASGELAPEDAEMPLIELIKRVVEAGGLPRGETVAPLSPYTSLYLPISPCISLYLPRGETVAPTPGEPKS